MPACEASLDVSSRLTIPRYASRGLRDRFVPGGARDIAPDREVMRREELQPQNVLKISYLSCSTPAQELPVRSTDSQPVMQVFSTSGSFSAPMSDEA